MRTRDEKIWPTREADDAGRSRRPEPLERVEPRAEENTRPPSSRRVALEAFALLCDGRRSKVEPPKESASRMVVILLASRAPHPYVSVCVLAAQNSTPASRHASATALTRPW